MASKKPAKPINVGGSQPIKKAVSKKAPAVPVKAIARKAPVKQKAKAPRKPSAKSLLPVVAAPIVIDQDARTEDTHDLMGLTIREARFIDLYLSTFKVGQSYIDAGFTAKNTNVATASGSRLLSHAKSARYLGVRAKAMFARMEEEQDRLMLTFTGAAYADVNELVSYRVGACRYCHGKFNRWQYTTGEWDRKMTEYAEKQDKFEEDGKTGRAPKAPEPKGGAGYDFRAEPNPDCPECWGDGDGRMVMRDTRSLSPAGQALYAGVEKTKDGLKMLMHSQEKARETLAKIRKMYEDSTSVNVAINSEELDRLYGEAMRKGAERMAAMREERKRLRTERGD